MRYGYVEREEWDSVSTFAIVRNPYSQCCPDLCVAHTSSRRSPRGGPEAAQHAQRNRRADARFPTDPRPPQVGW